MPAGTIILREVGTLAPAGYTLIGTTQIGLREPDGRAVRPTTFNVYRKD